MNHEHEGKMHFLKTLNRLLRLRPNNQTTPKTASPEVPRISCPLLNLIPLPTLVSLGVIIGGFAWIAWFYMSTLGTYGWHYDEPFYSAEALSFWKQILPTTTDSSGNASMIEGFSKAINNLFKVNMAYWNFDSGFPIARAMVGVPLLLFKFDPVLSRIPYAIVSVLALGFLFSYLRQLIQLFLDTEVIPLKLRPHLIVSAMITTLLIALSPTCFFQAHFVIPQTISFLFIAMGCQAMTKGFIQRHLLNAFRGIVLFMLAIVLNYQNIVLVPFILFNLIFFSIFIKRKKECFYAFILLFYLFALFLYICYPNLVTSFNINVARRNPDNAVDIGFARRFEFILTNLWFFINTLGLPACLCIMISLIGTFRSFAKVCLTRNWFSSPLTIYSLGTLLSALPGPLLFILSSNHTSAHKYLIDTLVVVSPLMVIVISMGLHYVKNAYIIKRIYGWRLLFNQVVAFLCFAIFINYLAKDSVNRYRWNYDYENVMREWIPAFYLGKEKGLVFATDWQQHLYAYTGGDGDLMRDYFFVYAGNIPEKTTGVISAIRLIDEPTRNWTDPSLNVRGFAYAQFLRERNARLESFNQAVIPYLILCIITFITFNIIPYINYRIAIYRQKNAVK